VSVRICRDGAITCSSARAVLAGVRVVRASVKSVVSKGDLKARVLVATIASMRFGGAVDTFLLGDLFEDSVLDLVTGLHDGGASKSPARTALGLADHVIASALVAPVEK